MKKRIGWIITVLIIVLIIGLLVWRFWPQSIYDLLSLNENTITDFSANVMIHFSEGQDSGTYAITATDPQDSNITNILEMIAEPGYRPDLRNLIPWGIDGVSGGKYYDGRIVTLNFYFHGTENEYVAIQFISPRKAVVMSEKHPGMRIYRPTDRNLLDKLVDYLQTNGVKSN